VQSSSQPSARWHAMRYAAEALQADLGFALTAVGQSGHALAVRSRGVQVHREAAPTAVGHKARALRCAAGALQADRELVLAAAGQRSTPRGLERSSPPVYAPAAEAVRRHGLEETPLQKLGSRLPARRPPKDFREDPFAVAAQRLQPHGALSHSRRPGPQTWPRGPSGSRGGAPPSTLGRSER
jgi:hypothetical protein